MVFDHIVTDLRIQRENVQISIRVEINTTGKMPDFRKKYFSGGLFGYFWAIWVGAHSHFPVFRWLLWSYKVPFLTIFHNNTRVPPCCSDRIFWWEKWGSVFGPGFCSFRSSTFRMVKNNVFPWNSPRISPIFLWYLTLNLADYSTCQPNTAG